jgi:hypothetical protein
MADSRFTCPYTGTVFNRFLARLLTPARAPLLTQSRINTAYAVAVTTDVVQFALGPFGWLMADEVLDVIAAAAMWRLLGFHPLLLPTFVIEVVPVIDMLPTWTGCVALVVAARKAKQGVDPPPPGPGQVIDV